MLCLKDYENYAEEHLDRKSWAFFSQGAERELTLNENARAFSRYTLIPRMLQNALHRDLSTTILGHRTSLPIGLAPWSYQKLAHPDGEIATSKAAEEIGVVCTLSITATTSLEDVANCIPNRSSPLWMQLYLVRNRSDNEELIKRATDNGYKALVLTIDRPVKGLQLKISRNGGMLVPPHINLPNVSHLLKKLRDSDPDPNLVRDLFDYDITWDDVAWIKSVSSLPLVLKGILTAEDARKAVECGAAAVWISNHGGRQLDSVSSTIDALPEIAAALSGSGCEIYLDGGIRWGSDVFKALALGATAVFIGRPVLWGLAHSGQNGVRSVLDILGAELNRTMHLSGCKDIASIGSHNIKRGSLSRM